jgi:hypothetical protein
MRRFQVVKLSLPVKGRGRSAGRVVNQSRHGNGCESGVDKYNQDDKDVSQMSRNGTREFAPGLITCCSSEV